MKRGCGVGEDMLEVELSLSIRKTLKIFVHLRPREQLDKCMWDIDTTAMFMINITRRHIDDYLLQDEGMTTR